MELFPLSHRPVFRRILTQTIPALESGCPLTPWRNFTTKPFLDAIVVEDLEYNGRFPNLPRTDQSIERVLDFRRF